MTYYYRVERIRLKPLTIIARSHDDAASILAHSLITGVGHRPDADFDIVGWRPRRTSPNSPPLKWLQEGYRGIAWPFDDGARWEMHHTSMHAP